jgi:AraC-like DNA-binding protein
LGETPANYLQRWRIGLVKKWLAQGRPLKLIVEEAGYSNESALSRAFKSEAGVSPREWLKAQALG